MTVAKRVVVDVGRWTATARPGRLALPAVRQACGNRWTPQLDGRVQLCRFPVGLAADVIAALEAMRIPVTVRGTIPEAALW